MRFNTSGIVPSGKTLSSASLKIYVTNDSLTTGGFEVHPESDSWDESTVNWNTQPTWNTSVLVTSSTPSSGSWLTITLPTSAISTSGNTDFGLRYTLANSNAQFSSREYGPQAAQLILNYTPQTTSAVFNSTDDGYDVSPVLTYTDTTPPPAPTNVTPSVGPNSVTLNWDQDLDTQGNNVTPAAFYTVYRDGTQIGTTTSDITTFNDTGLDTGSYSYTVKATDYCGNVSDASADPEATISDEMLFPGGSTPTATTANDPNPTTVGVQFTSATAEEVNGVQFYRAQATGDGSTIGLWDSSGNLLESGTVSDTDTTGWLSATFQDPVRIAANTTYTVGYYTPAGDYSYTSEGLYSPLTHGNVTALANGGVTHSGTGMVLPASTSNASNYYVSPIIGPQQAGGVSKGDILFEDDHTGTGYIKTRDADGNITDLGQGSMPDVSPDGGRIAYITHANDNSAFNYTLHLMNSDGSGPKELVAPDTSSTGNNTNDQDPRWSPDGQWIVFTRVVTTSAGHNYEIDKVKADGTGLSTVTSVLFSSETNSLEDVSPTWSPTKDGSDGNYRIAFARYDIYGGTPWRIYVVDSDGSNLHVASTADTVDNANIVPGIPNWSSNGSRIYFLQNNNGAGTEDIDYFQSSDGFTSSDATVNQLQTDTNAQSLHLSADGSTLIYQIYVDFGCTDCTVGVRTLSTSGSSSPVDLPNSINMYNPSFISASYDPVTPSSPYEWTGDAVSINNPSPHDDFLKRGIHINLSNTGVDHWQYCWSHTSSGSTPDSTCTSNMQTSSNADTSAVLDYSPTNPDEDWYLWVRAANTDNSYGDWNGGGANQPLKVHTPKAPVWVGVGDSYSSGHNQLTDERFCPTTQDYPWFYGPTGISNCIIAGAPHLNANDYSFSWVNTAVIGFNQHVSSQWQLQQLNVAISGMSTAKFGVPGNNPGSNNWAAGNTQAGTMRAALYERSDSWNVVSMTGGADDTNWTSVMRQWYGRPTNFFASYAPWNVSSRSQCPDTDAVYDSLLAAHGQIVTDLNGIVQTATRASSGVRVLNVGYPYVQDQGTACFGNASSTDVKPFVGSEANIDMLNLDHKSVVGRNTQYLDLTDPLTGFGSAPVEGDDLQLTRLYGWPHANGTGQSKISTTAQSILNGTNW